MTTSISHELKNIVDSINSQLDDLKEDVHDEIKEFVEKHKLNDSQFEDLKKEAEERHQSLKNRLIGLYNNMRKEINERKLEELIKTTETFYDLHGKDLESIDLYDFEYKFKIKKIKPLKHIQKLAEALIS